MSAQGGVWNTNRRPVDSKLLNKIASALKLMGPDGEFKWSSDDIAMVYCPFHSTIESGREQQPLTTRRGFVLTWDGRIDNRDELISDLKGAVETYPTDAVLVAAAFDRWEAGSFRRMIGDWAVSIWLPNSRELIFAVDCMAIRHIYYSFRGTTVVWSTDINSLVLSSSSKLHIDDEYIAGYFAHEPEAHVTPYREIRQVPPRHSVRISATGAIVACYRRFDPSVRIRYRTDAEYEEHFRHVFRQSVQHRLRSDRPILAELSGGLDSSSVVCIADNLLAKERALTPRLDTLSYYNATEPNGDDGLFFPKVEEKRGRVGWHLDGSILAASPFDIEAKEFSGLPGFVGYGRQLEMKRAAIVNGGGYRVILSGIGGDEFMGGIPNAAPQLADLLLQLKVSTLAAQLVAWALAKRRPLIHLLWQAALELLPASLVQHFSTQARVEGWIESGFAKRMKIPIRLLDIPDHFGFVLPTRRACVGAVVLMQNKMANCAPPASALEELRYPYLDQRLIEFILAIPANQLLRPGERRSLMRRALAGIVPREILSRRTKQFGARTPALALEANRERIQSAFRNSSCSGRGYINDMRFLEALHALGVGRGVHLQHIFRTIALELWLGDLISRGLVADYQQAASPKESGDFSATRTSQSKTSQDFHYSC
ncbi:MAG: Asparagine synthetase [Candidatus Sulfotelmatobacter sp.]|nr:Asparagine synthetase [Candidatus Sulfotelmatobacter sp.]